MRVLLLATDAYGGHGGIALYNRDIVEALVTMQEVDEIVIVPRNAPFPAQQIPDKARFLSAATGGKLSYVKSAVQAARARYDLAICGHINLLPLAVMLQPAIRAPLVLMTYGIDVWHSPYRFARQWLGSTDAIWSISATTRDRMNGWAKLSQSKYMLVPNAIHLERYGVGDKRPDLVAQHGLAGCLSSTLGS